jgi:hypothetical protein
METLKLDLRKLASVVNDTVKEAVHIRSICVILTNLEVNDFWQLTSLEPIARAVTFR